MTIFTDSVICNSRAKERSTGKLGRRKRNTQPKPLLPQVVGIYPNSDGELHLVIKGGVVDIGGEFWTTEKLADHLFYTLAKKEAVAEIVTVPCTNDENSSCKIMDRLEEYESSATLLFRKYIIRAEKLAGSYIGYQPNVFVINLSDLDERLHAELLDLQRTKSHTVIQKV
jgi:hypothetical protein